jgi:predicted phage terminase large subunit-like protein
LDSYVQTAKIDGPDVQIVLEQEPGSTGKSVTVYLPRRPAGYSVVSDRPTGPKEVRAQPFASQCGIQNVVLLAADWNQRYLDELSIFPNGRHDDQVDASCGAFTRLTRYPENATPPKFTSSPRISPMYYGVQLERHAQPSALGWFHRAGSG